MKFLIAINLLLTLKYSSTLYLECSFQITSAKVYACINTNLVINENNVTLIKAFGSHIPRKSWNSVKSIYFLSSAMRRLPRNVFVLLPKLKRYIIHGMDVRGKHLDREALINGDFIGAKNLNLINMNGVNLHFIRANVFEGADNLDFLSLEACGILSIDKSAFEGLSKLRSLSLNYNLIKILHNDTFKDLTNLKVLMVAGNFIERIDEPLFVNLHSIKKISFISNQLQVIDRNITRSLSTLEKFYLGRNICVDATFGINRTSVELFANVVRNCSSPDDEDNEQTLIEKASELTKQVANLQVENERLRSLLGSGQSTAKRQNSQITNLPITKDEIREIELVDNLSK